MTKAIDKVIETIEDHKKENYDQLNTEKLLEYLYAVKDEDENTNSTQEDRLQLTRYESQCALHQQHYQAQRAEGLEMFKSVILSGQNALRTGLLLNGGAAIAILAFIGNVANSHECMLPDLAVALGWFSFGALFVGIAAFLTYATQRIYQKSEKAEDIWYKRGNRLTFGIITIGTVAIGFFVIGTLYSYKGITSKKQSNEVIINTSKQFKTGLHEAK